MIEQTTYVLNAGVPPMGEVATIYGSPLVISNPLQPATEIPTLTLVSLGGSSHRQVRRTDLRWTLNVAGDVAPLDEPERERLLDMARRGEIVLGSGTMPDGFWEIPAPEDPDDSMRRALIEGRE
jgi:hypothetical protein